ncbi:uncharacterized protein LAESUDRAFT_650794, partial [Laetiporus sulphureus 93-53]
MTSYSQTLPQAHREKRSRSHAPFSLREQRQHQRHEQFVSNVNFDEFTPPTKEQMRYASSLCVVAQNGLRIQFGELIRDRRTIVCFIRHFWCAADQDYMYHIACNVEMEALRRADCDLIVIGVGSPAMIKSYRNIFRMPFEFFTDPTLRLHEALGMTRKTQDAGPDIEKGEYIRHGPLGGLAMVVRNAIRVAMPVWEKGGDVTQLGGEFVFSPGPSCLHAHRMTTTRSHASILHSL